MGEIRGKVPAVLGLTLFAVATACIPAVVMLGAVGGTLAALRDSARPRRRRR